jgi:hypothetical protein
VFSRVRIGRLAATTGTPKKLWVIPRILSWIDPGTIVRQPLPSLIGVSSLYLRRKSP